MVVADIYILKVFEEDVKGEEDGFLWDVEVKSGAK